MGYVIKDFSCPVCGVLERLVDWNVSQIVCCGKTAVSLISAPRVVGADSFNSHFDITQGQYFKTADDKKKWLKSKDKEQVEGHASPRFSGGGRIICSDTQAKKLVGANARKVRQADLPGIKTSNRRTSLPAE